MRVFVDTFVISPSRLRVTYPPDAPMARPPKPAAYETGGPNPHRVSSRYERGFNAARRTIRTWESEQWTKETDPA